MRYRWGGFWVRVRTSTKTPAFAVPIPFRLLGALRLSAAVFILSLLWGAKLALAEPQHAIAMHGNPFHGPDFTHFSYTNPDAPKGGTVHFGVRGSFDSLNPLIVKGQPVASLRQHVYESLLARSFDEAFTLYGLIAETIELDAGRQHITFTLNPTAHFSDGTPITVDDVVFSHQLLKSKGRPNHRLYYQKVVRTEILDPRKIRFHFVSDGDREMPLIIGLMPILPKHLIDPNEFETTSLDAFPIGSGPYIVDKVSPGDKIVYRRDPNYWAADLAVNRGRHNFDQIIYSYFRDDNALFEAFKKGIIDVRPESDPGRWTQGYQFRAQQAGCVVQDEFATGVPPGMSGFVFNTRRAVFADIRVRRALLLMFDFEWINSALYHGAYTRVQSYFDNSELSAAGKRADAREQGLLTDYQDDLLPGMLDGTYRLPVSDGRGRNRQQRRAAMKLLREAGYQLVDGTLRHRQTQAPLSFEILISNKDQERLALTFARALKRLGVTANVRQVDAAQYEQRRQTYDYDMIHNHWYASLSPGNEQHFYWGSAAADQPGTRNYMGAKKSAIDAIIQSLLEARTRPEFVSATRALDRLLMSGVYVIPLFYPPRQWVAHWRRIAHPKQESLYGYMPDSWWDATLPGAPAGGHPPDESAQGTRPISC